MTESARRIRELSGPIGRAELGLVRKSIGESWRPGGTRGGASAMNEGSERAKRESERAELRPAGGTGGGWLRSRSDKIGWGP